MGQGAILDNLLPSATSRRRLVEDLQLTGQLLDAFVRHTPASMALFDRDMRYLALSDRWRAEYGLGTRDVLGQCLYDVMPDTKTVWKDLHQQCLAGESLASEDIFLRADGRKERMRWELSPWRSGDSKIAGLVMVTEIITARKEIEEEARIRDAAMASAISPMVMFDLDGTVTYANNAFAGMLGYQTSREVVGVPIGSFWQRDEDSALSTQTLIDTGKWIGTMDAVGRDRMPLVLQVSANLVLDPDDNPIGAMASCVDLTGQREAEQALNESRRRLASLMDSLPGGFAFRCRNDLFWTMEMLSNGCFDVLGYPPEALIENKMIAYSSLVYPEDERQLRREILDAIDTGRPFQSSYRVITRKGDIKWMMQQGTPHFSKDGSAPMLEGVVFDITERVDANESLRRERDRAEQYLDVAASIIMALDRQGRVVRINRKGMEVTGYTEEVLIGRKWLDLMVDRAARNRFEKAFADLLGADGDRHVYLESHMTTQDGDDRVIGWNLAPVRDRRGNVAGLLGSGEDLTGRREIERQLLQAQKMQAVGELTGGLAHDFNNLLMAVQGNIEFLREQVGNRAGIQQYIDSALKAVSRGADLTQRLLAFSRKQLLRPEPTSLNTLITDMSALLGRTLGPHVKIQTRLSDGPAVATVDPAQLENAVLNLAINARDAMSDGGTLTIHIVDRVSDDVVVVGRQTLDPNDFVLVSVSDTGSGMASDVLDRAFEPFFTTKDPTKGSGLGLSMVYGFVTQSGGFVDIQSVPDRGTDVRLYLPRASEEQAAAARDEEDTEVMTGGSECILVVEDDAEVRGVIVVTLEGLGYQVLQADSADGVDRLLMDGHRPDLLLTDVMQPHGQDGIELAQIVQSRCPDCSILLMSGFAEDAIERNNRLGVPFPFMRKPFARRELAQRVRYLMDQE